ncbi:MAG: 4-hydroxy-3-methylbut-2-enyl diphosphate reductase [Nanoarchaeota archaeon]
MNVEIANHSGFCFGVKKAMDKALHLKEKANTLGPLIHNPQVVLELERKGVKKIDNLSEADASSIIIRTHGASEAQIQDLLSKGYKIIDLTCPFVKKVQDYAKQLEKQGFSVIVIGEKNHPEVEGIVGHIKKASIIENPSQAMLLPMQKKIGVVVQTTQTLENFEKIIKVLKSKTDNLLIHNTICRATTQRQQATIKLAKKSDLMIVIGGRDSGNTKRLKELCEKYTKTKHIESHKELRNDWFAGKKAVGLTAGASSPLNVIRQVKETIEMIK